MTTDPVPEGGRRAACSIGGRDVTIGGMAKGSGMIEPMMATMLGFVTTDAAVPQPLLERALARSGRRHVQRDHGRRRVLDQRLRDAARQRRERRHGRRGQLRGVRRGSAPVCLELALGIVRGGEGATKLVTVNVTGAASAAEARQAAKAIANSLLVKTAIHGGDPNWGRLIAVAGRAGVAFELSRAAVTIGSIVLFKDGRPHDEAAPEAAEYLKGTDLTVGVDLGAGTASSTVWTCDLSAEYVRINADYRT